VPVRAWRCTKPMGQVLNFFVNGLSLSLRAARTAAASGERRASVPVASTDAVIELGTTACCGHSFLRRSVPRLAWRETLGSFPTDRVPRSSNKHSSSRALLPACAIRLCTTHPRSAPSSSSCSTYSPQLIFPLLRNAPKALPPTASMSIKITNKTNRTLLQIKQLS
jgi:hypothetical protein